MSAGTDNAAAASVFNNSMGGLRNFLYNYSIQKPQLAQQLQLGQQQIGMGANQLKQSNLQTGLLENQAHLGTFSPDLDAPDPDSPAAPSTPPGAPATPFTSTPSGSALTNSVVNSISPDDAATASAIAPAAPPGASTSAAPSVPPSQKYASSFFQELPPDLQTKVLKQYALSTPHPELLNTADVVDSYNNRVMKTKLPPVNPYTIGNFGLGVTKATSGPEGTTFDYAANPGQAAPINGPDGVPSGQMLVNGVPTADPSYLPPEKVAGAMQDYVNVTNGQNLAARVQNIIDNHPEVYGQNLTSTLKGEGGSVVGRLGAKARAMAGDPGNLTNQRTLEMENMKGVLDTLSQVHVGRITEKEWGALSGTIPALTDSKETWQNWLTNFKNTLQVSKEGLESQLAPYNKIPGNPGSQKLPSVNPALPTSPIAPSTTGPGNGTVPGTNAGATAPISASSQAEVDALPKGAKFLWNGKPYVKN